VHHLEKIKMASPYGKKFLFCPQIGPYMVPNFWANLSLFGPYKGLFSKGIRPDNTGNECIFVGCNDKANSTQSTTIKGFCEDSKFEMLEATFT